MQILHMVDHKANINQICDNINNTFLNEYKDEKVFVRKPGPKFGEHKVNIIFIRKYLYVMYSSIERFRYHITNNQR